MSAGGVPGATIGVRAEAAATATSEVPGTRMAVGGCARGPGPDPPQGRAHPEEGQDRHGRGHDHQGRPQAGPGLAARRGGGGGGSGSPRRAGRGPGHGGDVVHRGASLRPRVPVPPSHHPKWSIGPCPAPSRQAAAPSRARCDEGLGRPDRLERLDPEGQAGGQGRREGAPGAVVVGGGHPLGLEDLDPRRPGHHVGGPAPAGALEVAALDHHDGGTEGAELLGRLGHGLGGPEGAQAAAGEQGRLAQVGRGHHGVGEKEVAVGVARPPSSISACPLEETSTGSTTRLPAAGGRQPGHRGDVAGVASMPVLTAAGGRSPRTASTWATTKSGSTATTPSTAAGVLRGDGGHRAVPYTPWAAKVRRSACIPAPPPESEPAMVSATMGVTADGSRAAPETLGR